MVGCVSRSMGGSGEITNYLINLDIIEIIQFCLKIYDLWRHLHLWVGVWVVGWMGGSVGQWVGSGHITKYRINLDLIKIIKLFEDLWFVETPAPMGGCMGQWVGSDQMTNLTKLELINIIWFCLKIYNLSRHPYLWVDGWVNGWPYVKPLKSNKSWPNWDNSIMDILLDILLKPPQPFIGLFLTLSRRIKAHLLLMYWIKNQSIGVSQGALLKLFWIFEYLT